MKPRCHRVMRYLFITVLLVTNSLVLAAQDTDSKKYDIDIKLKPEKARIMLGEPMFLEFEVTNRTPLGLCLSVGGDYRNRLGRPESFGVSVKERTSKQRKRWQSFRSCLRTRMKMFVRQRKLL